MTKINKVRTRKKIIKKPKINRLVVFRSNLHIYAQVINDDGKILACSSDIKIKDKISKTEKALKIGKEIGEKSLKIGIKSIVFDRNGYKYHGRVAAVAKGARDAGIKF